MSLYSWITAALAGLLATPQQTTTTTNPPAPHRPRRGVSREAVAQVTAALARDDRPRTLSVEAARRLFAPAPAPDWVPKDARLGMDDASFAAQFQAAAFANFTEEMTWLGYPYLAELSQRAEYRQITETVAKDMTRRWVKLTIQGADEEGDDAENEKLKTLNDEMKRHQLRDKFRRLAELDGFFGRGHLYIDNGQTDDRELLKTPLVMSKYTFGEGDLRGFTVVEPVWTYPGFYDATDPLHPDFFRPRTWYVMSKEVHRTRALRFVSRELPDLLKPAYAFGGISMSQLAKPYVDNWLRTRQSVSDTIHSYSVPLLKTVMSQILNGGAADDLINRANVFNMLRDNRSMMAIDKETEDFLFATTPLAGLSELQAQSQEHMASVSHLPLVVLTGITPKGLNATSDGELRVYEGWIRAMQEHLYGDNLTVCLQAIQLDKFGEIDPRITAEWVPLRELTEKEIAELKKQEADTDAVYVGVGALAPEEVRARIAMDPDLPYTDLDLSEPLPAAPGFEDTDQDGEPDAAEAQARRAAGGGGDSGGGRDRVWDLVRELKEIVDRQNWWKDTPHLGADEDSRAVRKLEIGGLRIGIETQRGETREGAGWSVVMPCDYGYVYRNTGRDGDRLDCYLGPVRPDTCAAFVVAQTRLDGRFDEFKVMLGFETPLAAQRAYDASFSDGKGQRRRLWMRTIPFGELGAWMSRERNLKSKSSVGYHENAGPDERCAKCEHWLGFACEVVAGAVARAGWCEEFCSVARGQGAS